MKNIAMKVVPVVLFLVLLLFLGVCIMKPATSDTSCTSGPCGQVVGENPGTLNVPDMKKTVPEISGPGSAGGDSFADGNGFSLTRQQILKHLRTANEVAKEAKASGHHPFGAVLVAPDGETVLMRQGNMGGLSHAE